MVSMTSTTTRTMHVQQVPALRESDEWVDDVQEEGHATQ